MTRVRHSTPARVYILSAKLTGIQLDRRVVTPPGGQMKDIEEVLRGPLKEAGFKKRARTWLRETPETLQVINLQKSCWGANQYYLNFALWIRSLGDQGFPNHAHGHVRGRAGDIPAPRGLAWRESTRHDPLDLDSLMSDDERQAAITRFLVNFAIPFLDSHSTAKALRAALKKGMFSAWGVRSEARSALLVPSGASASRRGRALKPPPR